MANEVRILVVDDEEIARQNLMHVLGREGWQVDCAADGAQATALINANHYQLVLTDLRMPGIDGLTLLHSIKERDEAIEVIVITAHASAGSAVEAMRAGAFFYIEKPFRIADVRKIVHEALEKWQLKRENFALKVELAQSTNSSRIVSCSEVMQRLLATATQIAPTDCTVLIHGETGVGKELIARHIHERSNRASSPFIAINCGVLSEELLANELFGHERGAFTGAATTKPGLLEVAEGGTLFLDEVTEMPPTIQVKLLRVLQEREFSRLGGSQVIKANIRILAATNRNPLEAVTAGILRQDLYFRLNILGLEIPPLRERKGDLAILVAHLLSRHAVRMGKPIPQISNGAMMHLLNYAFPGNIRELENILERAVALCGTQLIDETLLPENVISALPANSRTSTDAPIKTLAEMERKHILDVLKYCDGNKAQAANVLGIDRVSLWRKVKSYSNE
ncbi:MAG: sigma-54-dependent Fis family transcriptional regulator [Azonexaceae bacterium]|nr:sigma-54-dependent Fis family transcriptional regulator [Azonexaceae bacterium]